MMWAKTKDKKLFEASAPRLDTVLMVEEFIEKNSGEYTQIELFRNLPKKMVWRTFKIILWYLESIHKIVINKDGTITWIWNPQLVEKYLKNKESINDFAGILTKDEGDKILKEIKRGK